MWNGNNTQAVATFLTANGFDSDMFRGYLMIRRDGRLAYTLSAGGWVIKGENGILRFYSDAMFKLMYRALKVVG